MLCNLFLLCLIFSLTDLAVGLNGQTSTDGQNQCNGYFLREMFRLFADEKIDKIQQAFEKLKTEIPKLNGNKVAFTAQLAKDQNYSGGAILQFTKVITNIGGGLNSSDGVFYCPQRGIYSFFVNIMTSTNHASAEIHKNDKYIMEVYTDHSGNNWKTGSNEVILQLQRGDRVAVKSNGSVRFHPHATHFSGHKL